MSAQSNDHHVPTWLKLVVVALAIVCYWQQDRITDLEIEIESQTESANVMSIQILQLQETVIQLGEEFRLDRCSGLTAQCRIELVAAHRPPLGTRSVQSALTALHSLPTALTERKSC